MKEHLNLNTVSLTAGWVDTPQTQERLNARLNNPLTREELAPVAPKDESTAIQAMDRYETSIRGTQHFSDTDIESMDFNAVMEHLQVILEQSRVPEGRVLMSQAHHNITPQRVMQMFGAM